MYITICYYKIINKSHNYIDSCYIALWSDPDLGSAGDDFVGCDTLSDIFYCYNGDDFDGYQTQSLYAYGHEVPAIGFKFLQGPIVPSPGDSALFDDQVIYDYKNLKMSAFSVYIGGTDPDDKQQVYNFMKGLDRLGNEYTYNNIPTKFMLSGDPLTGEGDIDRYPADRRMMGTIGPFSFAPGDSQFVKIKMAVGQGTDRLNSISVLKQILNSPEKVISDPEPWPPDKELPNKFTLTQNYPNPFNPSTRIEYTVPYNAHVTIEIFNILGQKVKTLVDEEKIPYNYYVDWDGTNDYGKKVTSGIYMYRIKTNEFVQSKKMVLMK